MESLTYTIDGRCDTERVKRIYLTLLAESVSEMAYTQPPACTKNKFSSPNFTEA